MGGRNVSFKIATLLFYTTSREVFLTWTGIRVIRQWVFILLIRREVS